MAQKLGDRIESIDEKRILGEGEKRDVLALCKSIEVFVCNGGFGLNIGKYMVSDGT